MAPTDLTVADFQLPELDPTAYPLSLLVDAAVQETEKLAAAEISEETASGGGSSTNPAQRSKTLSRTPSPDEDIIIMPIRLPPPPPIQKAPFQHNRLSTPIGQIDDGFPTEAQKQRLRSKLSPTSSFTQKLIAEAKANAKLAAAEISEGTVRGGGSTNDLFMTIRLPQRISPLPPLQKPSFQHNRLSIPIGQTNDGFPTEAQKQRLSGKNKRTSYLVEKVTAEAKAKPAAEEISEETVRGGGSTNKQRLRGKNKPTSYLVEKVPAEAEAKPAAAEISEETVRGGGSTNLVKRRKTISQPPSPDEGLINTIRRLSLELGIAQPQPKLVIQKRLYKTDLSPQHNRLSIPIAQTDDDFLTKEEKQLLLGDNHLDVKVMAAAEAMSMETAKLCRWDMQKGKGRKTTSIYAINGGWNAFVKKNDLREGMVVQLWCFRLYEELFFAIVREPDSSA